MIFEWGTTSGDSWKQRVCGLKDRGTLRPKLCVFFIVFFSFLLFFLLFSLRFTEINYTIIC